MMMIMEKDKGQREAKHIKEILLTRGIDWKVRKTFLRHHHHHHYRHYHLIPSFYSSSFLFVLPCCISIFQSVAGNWVWWPGQPRWRRSCILFDGQRYHVKDLFHKLITKYFIKKRPSKMLLDIMWKTFSRDISLTWQILHWCEGRSKS